MRLLAGFRLAVVALVIVSMQACVVHRTAHYPPAKAQHTLSVGDEVIVVLTSGEKYKAVVAEVTDTELITQKSRYRWSDIKYVSHKGHNVATVAASAVGSYFLLMLVAAAAFVLILEHELDEDL